MLGLAEQPRLRGESGTDVDAKTPLVVLPSHNRSAFQSFLCSYHVIATGLVKTALVVYPLPLDETL